MKFTTGHYTKNTGEARKLLIDSGYKPYTIWTFNLPYLMIASRGYILGIGDLDFLMNPSLKELYAYDGEFHETEKLTLK